VFTGDRDPIGAVIPVLGQGPHRGCDTRAGIGTWDNLSLRVGQ
jgi:hypothetical protein